MTWIDLRTWVVSAYDRDFIKERCRKELSLCFRPFHTDFTLFFSPFLFCERNYYCCYYCLLDLFIYRHGSLGKYIEKVMGISWNKNIPHDSYGERFWFCWLNSGKTPNIWSFHKLPLPATDTVMHVLQLSKLWMHRWGLSTIFHNTIRAEMWLNLNVITGFDYALSSSGEISAGIKSRALIWLKTSPWMPFVSVSFSWIRRLYSPRTGTWTS